MIQDRIIAKHYTLRITHYFLGEFHEAIRVLLDARETYKEMAEVTYRLGGLHFLIQKEKEGLFFFETALKSDYDYLSVAKELYPTVIDLTDVQTLITRFKDLD